MLRLYDGSNDSRSADQFESVGRKSIKRQVRVFAQRELSRPFVWDDTHFPAEYRAGPGRGFFWGQM